MSAVASALAQSLAQHPDEDVLQALSLLVSLRPSLSEGLRQAAEQPSPRYAGSISTFSWDRCFGFIESEEAKADYGKDVFLSDREIGNHKVGDEISFTVVINKDGRPQARLLMPAGTAPLMVAPPMPVAAPPRQWSAPSAAIVPPAAPPTWQWSTPVYAERQSGWHQAANGETRYVGQIIDFQPERRFGFISCEAVHNLYGKDTFLSDQELGQFKVGDTVSFTIAINKDGRPQARNLQQAGGITASAKRPFPEAVHVPPPPRKTARAEAGAFSKLEDPNGRFVGSISCFFPEKHYGFIQSDDAHAQFGKDTFLSDQEIGSFSVGNVVSFRVELNKWGKPQARDLQSAA